MQLTLVRAISFYSNFTNVSQWRPFTSEEAQFPWVSMRAEVRGRTTLHCISYCCHSSWWRPTPSDRSIYKQRVEAEAHRRRSSSNMVLACSTDDLSSGGIRCLTTPYEAAWSICMLRVEADTLRSAHLGLWFYLDARIQYELPYKYNDSVCALDRGNHWRGTYWKEREKRERNFKCNEQKQVAHAKKIFEIKAVVSFTGFKIRYLLKAQRVVMIVQNAEDFRTFEIYGYIWCPFLNALKHEAFIWLTFRTISASALYGGNYSNRFISERLQLWHPWTLWKLKKWNKPQFYLKEVMQSKTVFTNMEIRMPFAGTSSTGSCTIFCEFSRPASVHRF